MNEVRVEVVRSGAVRFQVRHYVGICDNRALDHHLPELSGLLEPLVLRGRCGGFDLQRMALKRLEARTVALHGLSLAGGYTFTDVRDSDSQERVKGVPVNQAKLSINYDNPHLGLKGLVSGNYVWWNAPEDFNGKYTGTIWDLHLTQRLMPGWELSPELFFSAHNLFDGAQYSDSIFKNPGRWLEGGVRFRF